MSPALNGSSAIQRFEGSEIRDGITFDFYMGLSHHTFTLSLWQELPAYHYDWLPPFPSPLPPRLSEDRDGASRGGGHDW